MKAVFENSFITSFKIQSSWRSRKNQKACDSSTQTKDLEEYCDNSTQSGVRTEIIQAIISDGNRSSALEIVSELSKNSKQHLNGAILDGYLLIDESNIIMDPSYICDAKSLLELTIAKHNVNVSIQHLF
jgi:hypothetical protein